MYTMRLTTKRTNSFILRYIWHLLKDYISLNNLNYFYDYTKYNCYANSFNIYLLLLVVVELEDS